MLKTGIRLAAVAGAATLVACSGSDGETAEGQQPVETPEEFCATEKRAEPFSVGMAKDGEQGIRVAVVDSDPAPPGQFDNLWQLEITDANGEPVIGAAVRVQTWMPDHQHSSPRKPIVTELGDGTYEVERVSFHMPGYWEIQVETTTADEIVDTVMFPLCIE